MADSYDDDDYAFDQDLDLDGLEDGVDEATTAATTKAAPTTASAALAASASDDAAADADDYADEFEVERLDDLALPAAPADTATSNGLASAKVAPSDTASAKTTAAATAPAPDNTEAPAAGGDADADEDAYGEDFEETEAPAPPPPFKRPASASKRPASALKRPASAAKKLAAAPVQAPAPDAAHAAAAPVESASDEQDEYCIDDFEESTGDAAEAQTASLPDPAAPATAAAAATAAEAAQASGQGAAPTTQPTIDPVTIVATLASSVGPPTAGSVVVSPSPTTDPGTAVRSRPSSSTVHRQLEPSYSQDALSSPPLSRPASSPRNKAAAAATAAASDDAPVDYDGAAGRRSRPGSAVTVPRTAIQQSEASASDVVASAATSTAVESDAGATIPPPAAAIPSAVTSPSPSNEAQPAMSEPATTFTAAQLPAPVAAPSTETSGTTVTAEESPKRKSTTSAPGSPVAISRGAPSAASPAASAASATKKSAVTSAATRVSSPPKSKTTPRANNDAAVSSPRPSVAAAATTAATAGVRATPSAKKVAPGATASPVVATAPAPAPPAAHAPHSKPRTSAASKAQGANAAPPPAPASDPRRGSDYDRVRREAMKAQRIKEAAEAKERAAAAAITAAAAASADATASAVTHEHQPSVASPSATASAPSNKGKGKAPIMPPPSPPRSPRTSAGPSAASAKNTTPSPAATRHRHAPASSAAAPQSAERGNTAPPKGQYQIHPHVPPPPWARAMPPASAPPPQAYGDEEKQQQQQQQQALIGSSSSSDRSRSGGGVVMRPRPPPSRAANALARQRIMSNLAIGRAPTASSASTRSATTTSAASASATAAAGGDTWSATDRMEESTLETQRIVHRAQQLLRGFSAESSGDSAAPASAVPFDAPLLPPNATVASAVPRCYPRSSVMAPRVSVARFRRGAKTQRGGGLAASVAQFHPDRAAAVAAASATDDPLLPSRGAWDVSAELRYGHAVVAGLKSRAQNLTARLDERAATPLAPSSAPGSSSARAPAASSVGLAQHVSSIHASQQAELYESLRVTSSLENYYSLLSQLDLSVQRQRDHGDRGLIHHVLVGSSVSGRAMAGKPKHAHSHSRPRSSHSARPASAASATYAGPPLSAHQALRAQAQASAGENAWLHTNSLLPVPALARPLSGARVHPAAPPSHIPPYDSLADPHAASVLSARRAAVIAANRQEELRERPELAALLAGRQAALANEREQDAAQREAERRRRLRQHRPESERISQRPRSAVALGPGSPARLRLEQQRPPPDSLLFASTSSQSQSQRAPVGASSTFHLASSAYGTGRVGGSSARSRGGRMKSSPYPNVPLRPASSGAPARGEQKRHRGGMNGAWTGHDENDDRPNGDGAHSPSPEDEDGDGDSSALGTLVDWWSVSNATWPTEPSQLARDLATLGIDTDGQSSANCSVERPAQLLDRFLLAERCLQELHAQLGLPFLSASDAAHSDERRAAGEREEDGDDGVSRNELDASQSQPPAREFSLSNPPSNAQVGALLAAVRSRLACRDLVVRVVRSIAARERAVGALNDDAHRRRRHHRRSGARVSPTLVSSLREADDALFHLLDEYDRLFRTTFPARPEFVPPPPTPADPEEPDDDGGVASPSPSPLPFMFRGEEYASKVEREQAELEQLLLEQKEEEQADEDDNADDGLSLSADDASMEALASAHLIRRATTPAQLASAAAALVLGSIAQQARQKQARSARR